MYDACSDAKKATIDAMSFGDPSRSNGICPVSTARASAVNVSVISVAMNPGAIAFAVTLNLPDSSATARVKPSRPAFAAE